MKVRIVREEELERSRNYKFSEEDIQFLRMLNDKLRREEKRYLSLYDKLKAVLAERCLQRDMDDFNYLTTLSLFSKDRKCNSRYGVSYGDPIWEDTTWCLFTDEEGRVMLEENWNHFRNSTTHPLANVPFCYTMHCIVFHSKLLWQDILSIEDVWLSLHIEYQMFTDDKMKRRFYKLNKERIEQDRLM